MEEHISSYTAVKQRNIMIRKARKKKFIIAGLVIVVLVVIAVIIYSIRKANTHKEWLEYMDKYYYPFLEINNINEKNMGSYNTLWEDYYYKDKLIVLTSQRPRDDMFDFYVTLTANSGIPDNPDLWHVSFNNFDYEYWFTAKVDRDGNWKYYLSLNYGYANVIGCYITEDGKIEQDPEDPVPLSDNDRKVLNELLPQIHEVQDEMRNKILKGLT